MTAEKTSRTMRGRYASIFNPFISYIRFMVKIEVSKNKMTAENIDINQKNDDVSKIWCNSLILICIHRAKEQSHEICKVISFSGQYTSFTFVWGLR